MANPAHLKQLLRATASERIWNDWREANPSVKPDLSGLNHNGDTFAPAKLQNLNLQDVIFVNANLQEADLSGSSLQGADLSGADLNHAILRDVKLNRATLKRAKLPHALLADADLSDAEMEDADLSEALIESSNLSRAKLNRAKLDKARFTETQLQATVLREASLEQAHLTGALGLSEEQLAGTNLKDAELPGEVQKERIHLFDGKLSRIESASHHLQTLFFALLASCMYCWLTIASTSHAQLIADTATSPLPIIGAKVSIINFYRVMPFFLLIFYIYFHQHLQRLWDMLASLPAVFPDGTRLDQRSQPRHVSGFVRARCFLLKENSSPSDYLYGYLFIFLTWFNVPFTLLGFWWSFLPRRDLQGDIVTVTVIMLTTMTAAFGLWSYQHAVSALQTKQQPTRDEAPPIRNPIYRKIRKYAFFCLLISAVIIFRNVYLEFIAGQAINIYEILILLVMGNIMMFFGMPSFERRIKEYLAAHQETTWRTQLLSHIAKIKHLDMSIAIFGFLLVAIGFIFVIFHLDYLWIRLVLLTFVLLTILGGIKIFQQWFMDKWWEYVRPNHAEDMKQATLALPNIRLIPAVAFSLSLIFFMKINQQPICFFSNQDNIWMMDKRVQERTPLDYLFCYPVAHLNRKQISAKAPNWPGVSFENPANQDHPNRGLDLVTGASLAKANLQYALANNTFFVKADLYKANLQKAMLEFTDFRKAILQNADLSGAHLPWADLRGADLRWAVLPKANLYQTRLDGAQLSNFTNCHTQAVKSARNRVNLQNANLRNSSLTGADLKGADLTGADLSLTGLTGAQFNGAILKNANLQNAGLQGADLSATAVTSICWDKEKSKQPNSVSLPGADLTGANLDGTNLMEANLSGSNWANTSLKFANLYNVDLSKVPTLTASQLESACVDDTTILPKGFKSLSESLHPECAKRWGEGVRNLQEPPKK